MKKLLLFLSLGAGSLFAAEQKIDAEKKEQSSRVYPWNDRVKDQDKINAANNALRRNHAQFFREYGERFYYNPVYWDAQKKVIVQAVEHDRLDPNELYMHTLGKLVLKEFVERDDYPFVRFLLENGANPHYYGKSFEREQSMPALKHAKSAPMVKLLLRYKAVPSGHHGEQGMFDAVHASFLDPRNPLIFFSYGFQPDVPDESLLDFVGWSIGPNFNSEKLANLIKIGVEPVVSIVNGGIAIPWRKEIDDALSTARGSLNDREAASEQAAKVKNAIKQACEEVDQAKKDHQEMVAQEITKMLIPAGVARIIAGYAQGHVLPASALEDIAYVEKECEELDKRYYKMVRGFQHQNDAGCCCIVS